VREFAITVALVTLAGGMQVFAGVITKIMRESARSSSVATSCQKELAKFFRLLVNRLTRCVGLKALSSLLDRVKFILASATSHLMAPISSEFIEWLSTAHVATTSHETLVSSATAVTTKATSVTSEAVSKLSMASSLIIATFIEAPTLIVGLLVAATSVEALMSTPVTSMVPTVLKLMRLLVVILVAAATVIGSSATLPPLILIVTVVVSIRR
jgi:hypothetical protein